MKKQNGTCAICNQPEIVKNNQGQIISLAVDHCHVTGKTRGLLCFCCNVGLGVFKNNPNLLRKAAEYLELHQIDKENQKYEHN